MPPAVPDVATIVDPVLRNRAINDTYHQLSLAMHQWLGTPHLSNWCSFGKFASREVGEQLRELGLGVQTLRNFASLLSAEDGALRRAMRDLVTLPQQVPLLTSLLGLAKRRSALAEDAVLLLEPARILPVARELLASLRRLRDQLIVGNLNIYQNIANKFYSFLSAAERHPGGTVDELPSLDGDPRGFLRQAFTYYRQARAVTDHGPLAQQRRADLVHQANLLVGVHEQLVILQPSLEHVRPELRALTKHITLTDPLGTHQILPAGDDWGDFYQRMGFVGDGAPELAALRPDTVPALWPLADPRYLGTIGEYFVIGLRNPLLVSEPARPLVPMGKGLGLEDVLMDDSWDLEPGGVRPAR